MRISTSQIQLSGLNRMLEQQSQMLRTQQQLAAGKRILNPADDPAASARIVGLDQTLKVTEKYQGNIDFARSRLELEEGVISSVTNVLNRVRELAVQANNSSLTNDDRRSLAIEAQERLNELLGLGNAQDAGGEFLFSGYQGSTQPFAATASGPYAYNGDDGQRFIQIGSSRQIAVTDSGTSTFREIRNGNGTFTALDNPLNSGGGIIDPGSVANPSLIDGDTYNITFLAATSATGGVTYSDNSATADNLTYTLEINGTTVYSTDEADATPVTSLAGLAAEINDDMGTTGVRAYVDGGSLYLTNTSPSATPITITESMGGASDGDLDRMTGYFGGNLSGSSTPSITTTLNSEADFYLVEDSMGNVETSGSYSDGGSIAFNGIQTNVKGSPNVGDSFSISPSLNQDVFSTVRNLVSILESGSNNTPADSARLNNDFNRFFSDVDRAMENFRAARTQIGSRLVALDTQENLNDGYILQIKSTLSDLQDLDYTEAITRLNQQEVALKAAQQSYMRIQGLSLFNYL